MENSCDKSAAEVLRDAATKIWAEAEKLKDQAGKVWDSMDLSNWIECNKLLDERHKLMAKCWELRTESNIIREIADNLDPPRNGRTGEIGPTN